MRRRFARRMALMFLAFFGLVFAASALAVLILTGGGERTPGVVPVAVVGVVLLLIAFVVVGRTVRRTTAPVGDVMEATERLAGGDYSVRVPERGPGDIRRLARSFNTMAERLQAGEEERRNLLADVAHELRTPLSVIQGDVEGMLDGLYRPDRSHLEPVLEESRVMSRLLEDLLTLSTAEAGALRLHRQRTEPGELVTSAVSSFRARARAGGVSIDGRTSPGLPSVDVDPIRIGEVMTNLLLNAIRHTPPKGSIEVIAESAGPEGVAFLIRDTGSGIDPETLPHVFERFVSGGESTGAGLGLAIAKSVVEAHGGVITAESDEGRGTTMRFVLPAAPLR
jgi:signal transduction histidine kinase